MLRLAIALALFLVTVLASLSFANAHGAKGKPESTAAGGSPRADGDRLKRTATIADAGWLTGHWVGEGFGGRLEEIWLPPVQSQMIGLFRMERAGRPIVYEMLLIEEHEGGLRYRVKHFNPDFTGWEERDRYHEFPWVGMATETLAFGGLTLRKTAEDEAVHILTVRGGDGTAREEILRYRRVRP